MDLLRSFLFVPAGSSRKLAKARSLHPDAFIYDLEDAVPPGKKLEARGLLAAELPHTGNLSAKIFVRVNRFGTSFFDGDLAVAVTRQVDGIVLPKCGAAEEIAEVDRRILELEKKSGLPERGIRLMPMLENAKGIAHASEIARCSSRILALNFGAEDYCVDMGISRTKAGDEISFARFSLALAAKITANGPLAVAATKRIIVESRGWDPAEMWREQVKILGPVFVSNDAKEGAIAFAEKRPPRWTGT